MTTETSSHEACMAGREKFTESEIEKTASDISQLQGNVGGDVEQRSPGKMAELIKKNLVFYLKDEGGEIVASAYLEPFPNGGENVYILGGLSSKKVGALTGMRKELVAMMEKHRDKTLFARTKPRIAKIFLTDMGFREVSKAEFKNKFQDNYINYMKGEVKDFSLTEGVHTYLREKTVSNPTAAVVGQEMLN